MPADPQIAEFDAIDVFVPAQDLAWAQQVLLQELRDMHLCTLSMLHLLVFLTTSILVVTVCRRRTRTLVVEAEPVKA